MTIEHIKHEFEAPPSVDLDRIERAVREIIGAIGVSGVLSAQDAQIARAGIQALGR